MEEKPLMNANKHNLIVKEEDGRETANERQ